MIANLGLDPSPSARDRKIGRGSLHDTPRQPSLALLAKLCMQLCMNKNLEGRTVADLAEEVLNVASRPLHA